MSRKHKPIILWVDLTASVKQAELPRGFTDAFEAVRPNAGSSIEAEIGRINPDVLLFDFDYPERTSLKLMERTKLEFPRIPIVMMTVQHSESLAVWAFRARVWDYLVKPLSAREIARCTSALGKIFGAGNEPGAGRNLLSRPSPVPDEARVTATSPSSSELMPALAYIERNFRNRILSAAVAKTCNMNTFQFSRAFSNSFGITFKEYLLRMRIREACRLLEKPDISVTDVTYMSGFNDPSYFSRVFKRYVGVAPSEFACSQKKQQVLSDEKLSLILHS